MTRKASTADIVERLGGVKIVVVGDVMLDRFVDGTVDRGVNLGVKVVFIDV